MLPGSWQANPRIAEKLDAYHLRIQESHIGVIELKEDDERHVEAMIEFFYNFSYDSAEDQKTHEMLCKCCTKLDDHTHSFTDVNCKLWPLGLSIAMHVLGDKYDIISLRQYACSRLEYLLRHRCTKVDSENEMVVMEHAYLHSRPEDDLRKFVKKWICEKAGAGGLSSANNFFNILEDMPDVNEALIKDLIKRAEGKRPVEVTSTQTSR